MVQPDLIHEYQLHVLAWILAKLADGTQRVLDDAHVLPWQELPVKWRDVIWAFDGWGLTSHGDPACDVGRPGYAFCVRRVEQILQLRAAASERCGLLADNQAYPLAGVPGVIVGALPPGPDLELEALRRAGWNLTGTTTLEEIGDHFDQTGAALAAYEQRRRADHAVVQKRERDCRLERLLRGCLAPLCEARIGENEHQGIYCERHLAILTASLRCLAEITKKNVRNLEQRVGRIHPAALVTGAKGLAAIIERRDDVPSDLRPVSSRGVARLGVDIARLPGDTCRDVAAAVAVADRWIRLKGVAPIPGDAAITAEAVEAIVRAVLAKRMQLREALGVPAAGT